jgi:hypothetical protein
MNQTTRRNQLERGQTAVLFALMLIGLILFVGLAVDGGNVFNERRITQNAADASALGGVHYIAASDAPQEVQLRKVINSAVEANDVPDSDGIPGNEINTNITIYYTDDRGNRLVTQPCHVVPCGTIPLQARGVEVHVRNQAPTFFLGLVNRDTALIGASAIAVARGGSGPSTISDNVLVAFGTCQQGDQPLDVSAKNTDFIGGVHSATWFLVRGNDNHFHGQVTYGVGQDFTQKAPDVPPTYEPQGPAQSAPIGDPFADLTVEDFHCTTGDIGTSVQYCYDLSNVAGTITNKVLRDRGLLTESGQGAHKIYQLAEGLYYGGNNPIDIGEPRMSGVVTWVSNEKIKIREKDIQFTGYMPADSDVPGLLMYSGYQMANPCQQFDIDPQNIPINLTSNTGTERPRVYHDDSKVAGKGNCVDLANPANCYEEGSNVFRGLIYAPGGRVATSGEAGTYIGAIVAFSIRINGESNRVYGQDPDIVGALFVRDSNLFPVTEQRIYLDR